MTCHCPGLVRLCRKLADRFVSLRHACTGLSLNPIVKPCKCVLRIRGFWHTKTTISSRSSVALAASKSTRCPQAFNVASIQCRVPVFVEARGNGKVAHGKQCGQETSPPGQQTRSRYVGEPVRCFYWDRFHMSWAPPPSGVIPIHAHSETL